MAARDTWRQPLVLFVLAAAGAMLLGAPAGLVWKAVSPRPEFVLTRQGPVFATPEPHAVIAADGWFAVITAVAGLLCGGVAYVLVRPRLRAQAHEVAVLLGLAVGGLLASSITWYVGSRVSGLVQFREQVRSAPSGTHVTGPLQLHAVGLVVVWSLLAVLVFAILTLLGAGRRAARPASVEAYGGEPG